MTNASVIQPSTASQPITLDWDDVMSGNFPDTSHQQRWQEAVTQAADALFTTSFIEVNRDRLQSAIDLVLGGHVHVHEDGTATVKSGSHTYEILDTCSCADSRHRSMYCKHFLSMLVFRDACERFHTFNGHRNGQEIHEAPQEALQAKETPQPGSLPEATSPPRAWECARAPSSCTLKWAINGIELMLTLRAADDQALFNRIGNVLPRIEEKMEAHRQQRQAERQAQVQQPGSGSHGNGHSTHTGSSEPDDEDHWCHVHDTRLWMHTKNGQTWYSHRTENGTWCRGT